MRFLNAFKRFGQLDQAQEMNGQARGLDEFSAPTATTEPCWASAGPKPTRSPTTVTTDSKDKDPKIGGVRQRPPGPNLLPGNPHPSFPADGDQQPGYHLEGDCRASAGRRTVSPTSRCWVVGDVRVGCDLQAVRLSEPGGQAAGEVLPETGRTWAWQLVLPLLRPE